tara:strand:- start:633 stop:839 length:207 start_codon:yes stop_codon:yes gene_type:complete
MFDDIDMERLSSLLDLLQGKGVIEFQHDELRIKLAPEVTRVELPALSQAASITEQEITLEDDLFYSAG